MTKTINELHGENQHLRLRLEEAEAIVEAIRNGVVDAVIVSSPGESVYTLEGAERPYRLLVEAMQQAVAVLNPQGVLLYCNPRLAELLMVPVDALLGSTLNNFLAMSDDATLTDMLKECGNSSTRCEVRLICRDGTTFPASFVLSILPSQKYCLLITDLSQQQQYDELVNSKTALRLSEIRYRRLFETAKDGILILDTLSGKITDANPFMTELLGYSHEHFLGKELWEIGLFSDKSANEAAVRELQEKGYIRYEHLPLETTTGRRVEVEVVANSYCEDEQSVIQCNIRDITERSHLEAERDSLAKLMREQSTAMEDLHRRKDEFLAMLSHELRNPLSPIASALQLLSLQKNEDRVQHQARTIIERQVGQLTRLIDDLLEVSRITTGRIHLQQERTRLDQIVKNAVETVRPLIDRRKHVLTFSLSPQPIWLFADAARLEQMIVNLLTNAAKFTDEGGRIEVVVSVEGRVTGDQKSVSDAGSMRASDLTTSSVATRDSTLAIPHAVIRIRDTGVGIAPELLPHIFDLFTQAERSLDRSQGGLGIGLALVMRIVEMHAGSVKAVSELGVGSEFTVRLPMLADSSDQMPSSNEETESNGPPLRILVVDDNEDASQMLGMLLLRSGHEVLTVHDGPTTLIAAQDFRPNVVLLDIGLPEMDGYEVAKRMRQQEIFKDVILVAMTGYGQDSDRLRSKEAGFDHHLVKPPDFNQLNQILATASKTT